MSALSKNELLILYKKNVVEIRKYARNHNLSEKEIDEIFVDCLRVIEEEQKIQEQNRHKLLKCTLILLKIILVIIFLFVALYIVLNVHQATSSIVLRNVQGFIYPGLKFLRFLSVPFVERFPWLTRLYDESCLVQNPFFFVTDMECWPCENVHSVFDISGVQNKSIIESGIPYLISANQRVVTFSDLQKLYFTNKEIFDENANQIKSTNKTIGSLNFFFNEYKERLVDSNVHVTWRINRMVPARLIRKLFPRPTVINKWTGQSTERFIFIDGIQGPNYILPNPECSYVFLIQGSGERSIVLKPTLECSKSCKTISIVLQQSHVLWYNWWYWRPISLPVKNSSEVSVTYMNSYC